ncbi:MAG: 16S rRNA (cytosine(1402)-N(4))-methyltransferase RsmH [bacterium]
MAHTPVMLSEAISFLEVQDGKSYLDLTAGFGGHASEILKKIPNGQLYLIDRDDSALNHLKSMFSGKENVHIMKMNFSNIDFSIKFDGILADLGVSSFQFDSVDRGFSYRFDAPLDLRMDRSEKNLLEELLANDRQYISDVIRKNSDEYQADEIASEMKKRHDAGRLKTTFDLKQAIIDGKRNRDVKQGLKRVFMALRMYVNSESESLHAMIEKVPRHLNENGRFVILTYHSIEDRMVKEFFKKNSEMRSVTKKVVRPSYFEVMENKRARSAKMRIYEKTA